MNVFGVSHESLTDSNVTGRDGSVMSDSPADLTTLLQAISEGDPQNVDRLMNVIYDDLKRLAANQLRSERSNHTLHPTALVHEAYLRLINQKSTNWQNRLHFFSIAARIIRRILIDHARERCAKKRGGTSRPISIFGHDVADTESPIDLISLDEALTELAELSERQARIVELRFFGGLTISEVAESMGIGSRSVDREWQVARVWLFHRLSGEEG
jgi:RNA polymerase sigma-70 factor, ECF subfamily